MPTSGLKCQIKAIIPRKWESQWLTEELADELLKIGDAIKEDFDATVETWSGENKPTFSNPRVSRKGRDIVVEISTDSELWAMLNDGTPPHLITSRTGGALSFQPWHVPKTRPGQLRSFPGRRGGATRFAKQVSHPGTQPRNWVLAAQMKYSLPMQSRLMGALERGVGKGMPGYIDKKKYSSPTAVQVRGATGAI